MDTDQSDMLDIGHSVDNLIVGSVQSECGVADHGQGYTE